MNRRKFIKRTLFTGLGLTIGTGYYAWQIEPFWLEFVHVDMPLQNLPDELEGKTLMQLSDLHVGNRFNRSYLIDSMKKAAEYQPDIVVYTGDFISYENEKQFAQLEEVMQHAVLGKMGTLGILGNHDYAKDWSEQEVADQVVHVLKNAGVHMLMNDSINISGLNIIGFEDAWGTNFRPSLAMKNYRKDEASVVLCHNPDVCDTPIWGDFEGWILSGHTHGGQCKPPFLPPPILPVKNPRYTAGKIELQANRTLYINRALGHLHQVRFLVRPEITIFTLRKA